MLSKRVTLFGLLQAAAILTILFSVVTSFDFAHRNIELFSHFRLQYLVASLVLLAAFSIFRSPVYIVPLLATVLLNASYVLPWYFGGTLVESDTTLKLLHANIFRGNDQYDRLLKLVETEQPDIIFLQEFSPEWLNATKPLLVGYPFSYVEPREGAFGIALFSRLALDSVTHVDSAPLDFPTIIATLTVDGRSLTLISTHAMVPLGRFNYEARNEQLQSVTEIARQAKGAVILTGDFNTTVWARPYRELEERTGLRNTRRGTGILPTWPTFMPVAMIAIDHALVSRDVGVVETRTGPRIGSDHLPLIITVAL
jgi:endonuclease/exonuclease/phosphatase (EEP) superfamily protein YafD